MCKRLLILFLLVITPFFLLTTAIGLAQSSCITSNDPCKDLTTEEKVSCYEKNVNVCQQESNSLSAQVEAFNSSIAATNLRIMQTEQQIENLTNEINSISDKISNLESSLTALSNVLIERIIASYKNSSHNNLGLLLFNSSKLSNLLVNLQYLQIVQKNDQKILFAVETTKMNYAQQKQLREEKKTEQEQLQKKLGTQKTYLQSQQKAKQNLLDATNNSEAVYQDLLDKARRELAAFSAFTTAAGGGETTFGNGSNGWYYTQRDPQWSSMLLPGSSSSTLEAGCAVTSVAMVCKSYGQNVTPATIISNRNNFIYGDLWNWAFSCSGKSTDWIGTSRDQIKNDVKNNIPVILRLIAPSVSGLHFVVAYAWDDGKSDFKIHDPYYGPDKYFSERYSWSQVTDGIAIH
ncbi:MAG: C39 family peptidase [Patescibacteria group bacterium]|nr:C39 family peptidase [Patescibacteria group bacterium]